MYTCQSGQQPPQVGNPSQYVTRSPMDGTQNKPQYRRVRADPNQPPPYMQVRADVSQPQNVQFTSHNGVYYNGQMSNDQALRNPQHGPTAARISTTMQTTILTQTANAQSRSHSLPNSLNCQPDHATQNTIGLLKKLLERDTPPNYWPQQSPNGGIQPNVTNSLQSCASTPDQHVTIYNNQTVVTNYPATGYMAQQLNNAQTNLGQNVNGMARQPQSQNSTVNTFVQDAQKLCNGTLESGVAYNQQPALHHSRGYRINGTQHGGSPHVALSSQMPSAQSFTNNNYAQMANSSVSSNQMPSHQSFTSNNYAQMANSSSVSSNQMPSPQSFTINAYVRMENSSGASSSQMPSPQSFTSNGYTQITNSLGASSNQMPSPQSFASNGYTQMTNSSGASSNRMSSSNFFPSNTCVQMANSAGASSSQMPSPQSFSSNTCVQMTNLAGASSNRMSSSQSFPSTTCVQMANSAGASSSPMPSPQSFSSNTCVQMANSAGASSSQMPSPQSFTSNGYTQMANSAGASSSQMPSPQSFTSNGYAQMTNSLGAPSQLSSPQSFTSNSYGQMANSSTSSGAFLPTTSMTPQTQHSGRDNSVSSQAFIYPNGSQYHNQPRYSKMNSTNVVMSNSGKADSICQNPTEATQHNFPVKNTFHPGNTVKSIVKDNNAKCAPTVQSEGYSITKRLSFNRNSSQSSKQPTSEASHASAPVQKGFYVTVTEDKTGFKADNVIFLGNKVDTSRFTKESVQGSSSNYAQLEQLPGKISQQRNDKQPPLQSNAKLPETVGSTVKLVEQRAVAVVQPLSQTINQVFSMQEHSQMSHGQCKNGTIKQMGGNLEKSRISPQHVKDDSRVCLAVSSDGTKVSLIEDTGPYIVGTDMTSTKLSVAEDTQHEDVVSDSHWEVTPTPQLSVTTEVSVSQTGENNSEMQEDSDAMDLSLVPTIAWTFDKLMTFVETTNLKCKQMQSEDLPVIDLSREIMCLFWEGRIDKLKNELKTDNYLTLMAEVTKCINRLTSDSVIVSQVDCSWDKIKDGYQVLNDDYVHPKVTYTSSWLNTNEQLDNIDKEFGFPQSLKYCPDELESDNQSKLGSDDEMDEKEDSGVKDIITENGISVDVETTTDSIDLCSLLEIHVMPPDEAKIVFEQVHNYQAKSEKPADQSEELFSGSVVNDGKADTKKPEEKVEPDMQEFCCVIRCIAAISGKPITKCQCKQKQDSKGLIMNTENTEQREKLSEQCTEVGEIICLSDDDDEMHLSFFSAEPKSFSLPSTSSMADSCNSSIIEIETEMETSVLTSEAEGHCGQAEKNATDQRRMSLGMEEGPTPTGIHLRESSDAKLSLGVKNEKVGYHENLFLSQSPDPNNISLVAKPNTCKRTVGLEEDDTDLWEILGEQCTDIMETIDLTTYDDEMHHSFSNSEPGSISLPSTSSIGHSYSSSIIEKGTKITTVLTTNEVETTVLTSEVEDNCGQAEQNPTDMTSEVEDNCGQAEQNPTDMTSEVEDNCGQAEPNPTDRGHISFGIEKGQTPTSICQSNKSSDAKVCFLNSLSLGQSHVRDPKKNLSLDGRPKKRKRMFVAMSTFQKKMKRCKQSSLSTKLPTIPLGKPKHVDKLSIQENIMDFEYVTNVIPVKLALFGSNNGKRVINGRGINRDNCFSDHGIPPPQIITVYIKTRRRITPVIEVPVKPQIFEDPHESQAIVRLQNLSVITDTGKKCTLVVKSPVKQIFEDPPESQAIVPLQNLSVDTNTGKKHTLVVKSPVKQIFEDPSESRAITLRQILTADSNTWKKSTAVLKSPVKRHIFESPLESSPTSVKQRIHNEWQKTVVPTSGKYKKRRLTPGNYMVTCSLSERSPKKPESVQPTNALNHPVCSERRLSRLLSRGTEKKKQSLRLDIRKSILHGYKHKKNKSKESPVKCNKPSDGMGSKSEGRNHAFMPKEKKIILKFSVLPSTFNFKDGSTGTDSLDTPDLVKAQDRISKTDVKGPRGDWALVPSKKYCPLPSTSSTVPKETTTFHQFQKKYLEAKQPSGDE